MRALRRRPSGRRRGLCAQQQHRNLDEVTESIDRCALDHVGQKPVPVRRHRDEVRGFGLRRPNELGHRIAHREHRPHRKALALQRLLEAGEVLAIGVDFFGLAKLQILEMTRGKMGCTTIVDGEGRLAGILTDGDLRRLFERDPSPLRRAAGEAMTKRPVTIARTELASVALRLMEERKITSVPVVDEAMRLEGLVQIHDLWRLQLF